MKKIEFQIRANITDVKIDVNNFMASAIWEHFLWITSRPNFFRGISSPPVLQPFIHDYLFDTTAKEVKRHQALSQHALKLTPSIPVPWEFCFWRRELAARFCMLMNRRVLNTIMVVMVRSVGPPLSQNPTSELVPASELI